jgi:glucose uptake protein
MFIVPSYVVAVIFCIITMLCWGSWSNTQKLTGKTWRFELFYWDYVLGIVLLSLVFGLTLGSFGEAGRGLTEDLQQAEYQNIGSAFLGGVVFNLANVLVVAAIAVAGMSVAFPVGIGLALVIGVIINYISEPTGNPVIIFAGVGLVAVAIVLNAIAYKKLTSKQEKVPAKGILLALIGGALMSTFYFLVQRSMSLNFSNPDPGKMTPYSAVFVFSLGILVSNFIFNTVLMKKPVEGEPVGFKDYFKGKPGIHLIGILGGIIWCVGMAFSIISAEQAGPAISYGLGQGATLVAALWGVFIWKEFKEAPKGTNVLLALMFVCFVIGLGMVIYARNI